MEASEITRALRGHWYGSYGLAFCPAHRNTRTPALRLSNGEGGRLLALCSAGCQFRDVMAELRRLGLAEIPKDFWRDATSEKSAQSSHDDAARIKRAKTVWATTEPIAGTLAEQYLRRRAIEGALPSALRFAALCWHPSKTTLPAMVAEVRRGLQTVGVHRTYLAEPGVKAETSPVKAMLGCCSGGAVRLSDGSGPLVVAEGIETMLSLRDASHSAADDAIAPKRFWAALSTSGIAGLKLPDAPGEIIIAPDGDAPGRAAADKLAHRANALSWQVSILEPPGDGLDWNDWAREIHNG